MLSAILVDSWLARVLVIVFVWHSSNVGIAAGGLQILTYILSDIGGVRSTAVMRWCSLFCFLRYLRSSVRWICLSWRELFAICSSPRTGWSFNGIRFKTWSGGYSASIVLSLTHISLASRAAICFSRRVHAWASRFSHWSPVRYALCFFFLASGGIVLFFLRKGRPMFMFSLAR